MDVFRNYSSFSICGALEMKAKFLSAMQVTHINLIESGKLRCRVTAEEGNNKIYFETDWPPMSGSFIVVSIEYER